jgi:hypothetical protein
MADPSFPVIAAARPVIAGHVFAGRIRPTGSDCFRATKGTFGSSNRTRSRPAEKGRKVEFGSVRKYSQ